MRLALIIAITISILAPQQRQAPSVVGAQTFVSTFGRFSIALPNPTRFGPLTIPTPFGNARGNLFQWETKEATFGVGFGDAAQPLDGGPVATKQFFDEATERFNKLAKANSGNIGKVKQISLDKHQGIEQRVDLFTGTVVQRTYAVSRRVYEVVAVMNNSQQAHESLALGVLDSFKVLSEAEVKSKQAEETAKAGAISLPQTPAPQRAGTDASDRSLRGRVKSVLTETIEGPSETGSPRRSRESLDSYNEQGNLIKSEWYDDQGDVLSMRVYGYIDNSRVSRLVRIHRAEDPPPPAAPINPAPETKKRDPRFQFRSEFKYDEQNRLTEEATFLNNGDLWSRTVYKYTHNRKEQFHYSKDGTLSHRAIYILDDKGNAVQETGFNDKGEARYKTTYTYEFDSTGNWTRRTSTQVEITDGREVSGPSIVHLRTITYY